MSFNFCLSGKKTFLTDCVTNIWYSLIKVWLDKLLLITNKKMITEEVLTSRKARTRYDRTTQYFSRWPSPTSRIRSICASRLSYICNLSAVKYVFEECMIYQPRCGTKGSHFLISDWMKLLTHHWGQFKEGGVKIVWVKWNSR